MNEPNGAGGDRKGNRFIPAEQRKTADSKRRSGDDRRQDEEPYDNSDKREDPNRR